MTTYHATLLKVKSLINDRVTEKLAAMLCGSRPGVQSASLIMMSLMTS